MLPRETDARRWICQDPVPPVQKVKRRPAAVQAWIDRYPVWHAPNIAHFVELRAPKCQPELPRAPGGPQADGLSAALRDPRPERVVLHERKHINPADEELLEHQRALLHLDLRDVLAVHPHACVVLRDLLDVQLRDGRDDALRSLLEDGGRVLILAGDENYDPDGMLGDQCEFGVVSWQISA